MSAAISWGCAFQMLFFKLRISPSRRIFLRMSAVALKRA
jgi:hypothetical protein